VQLCGIFQVMQPFLVPVSLGMAALQGRDRADMNTALIALTDNGERSPGHRPYFPANAMA